MWSSIIAGLQPDVIEAGDPYTPAWAAQRAARLLDVPSVGFYHSDLFTLVHHRVGRFLDPGTRAYIKRLYGGFDLVLSPSRLMAEQLHRCGVGEVQVQPLGVDLEAFQPQRAKLNARARWVSPRTSTCWCSPGAAPRKEYSGAAGGDAQARVRLPPAADRYRHAARRAVQCVGDS